MRSMPLGVAHIMSGLASFATNFTDSTHPIRDLIDNDPTTLIFTTFPRVEIVKFMLAVSNGTGSHKRLDLSSHQSSSLLNNPQL